MPVMLSKIYEASKEAGASDERAREAAEEIAAFDARLIRVESKLNLVLGEILTLILGVATLVMRALAG